MLGTVTSAVHSLSHLRLTNPRPEEGVVTEARTCPTHTASHCHHLWFPSCLALVLGLEEGMGNKDVPRRQACAQRALGVSWEGRGVLPSRFLSLRG